MKIIVTSALLMSLLLTGAMNVDLGGVQSSLDLDNPSDFSANGRSFTAYAPAPSSWGFPAYGSWVNVGGSSGWNRIRAHSTNGVDITMQIRYKTPGGRTIIDAAGGLSSKVDYQFKAKCGGIMVRFKVGTLRNRNKSGATVKGTIH